MSELIAEGKTKRILRLPSVMGLERSQVSSKDDATAGDGKRHEVISGKAALSTKMTVNTFWLLRACRLPVAFENRDSETSFIAPLLRMIPIEMVARGIAKGSYLQRHPKVKDGFRFDYPVVEFFLKTKDRSWPGVVGELPCDDPLMVIEPDGGVYLYDAHACFTPGRHFTRLEPYEAYPVQETAVLIPALERLTFVTYLILAHTWKLVGERQGVNIELADFKIEFGIDSLGQLRIGDVIDGDSCRILVDGKHADKQGFRDGASIEQTKQDLATSAELSDLFSQVQDEVIDWAEERFMMVNARLPAFRLQKGLQVF